MRAQIRIIAFIGVMLVITVAVAGVAVALLYDAAVDGQRERLREVVEARARLIESVGRYDLQNLGPDRPDEAFEATIGQIREAHRHFEGFGETGEFTLAQRRGDQIVFLLSHRHRSEHDQQEPGTIPLSAEFAEPMRRALRGESGTLVGLDYRGATVLAAFEPIAIHDLGVVAKIDLTEVRSPFVRAGLLAALVGIVLIAVGARIFLSLGNPLVAQLQESVSSLERVVDEHRAARDALAKSERHFRSLVESSPLPTLIADRDGGIFFLNRMFRNSFGYGPDDIPTLEDWWAAAISDPDHRSDVARGIRSMVEEVETGDRQPAPVSTEIRCKDGSTRWIDLTASRVGERTLLVLNDVTAHRRLEAQLQKTQRLESIGRLSGGVAHDFNNMLVVILTLTNMAIDELEPGSTLRADLEQVRDAADRAARLTKQLLAFSRKQVLQPKIVDLNELVDGMDGLLRRVIGEDIDLTTLQGDGLSPVKVDPAQVEQVIMNLVVNARDAMPEGGKLTVETADVELDADYAERHPEVIPGRHVLLAVSDSGIGMDEATQKRIFDPFFTTKEVGQGTGLGLATVYGIVKQSGGHIWFYSEQGGGTTFKVYFPAVPAESATESAAAAEPGPSPDRRQGVVLLLEDADPVRAVAERILSSAGFEVLSARTGDEGVALAQRYPGAIDLLLTDVVMPGMSGRETARLLEDERPELAVLYMSGYTDNAIVHHGVLDEGTNFIQKPFTRERLLAKVEEVLEGRTTERS